MDDHDRLRDLSSEDAEELRAFLEKRKWFEQKLSVLEAAEPLYPFIHPVLEPTPDGTAYQRVGEAGARWQLPAVDKLKAWQRERDELEEEILAFDGGDLGRMKLKTRAITLIPLTRPSTELVEITLVLILLIDKLLTLLRRRSDVLEVTRMRLKWDDLRWRFRSESVKLQADIDAFLIERAAWSHDTVSKDTMCVEPGSEAPRTHADLHGSPVMPKTPVRAKVRPDHPAASPSATTPNHADLFASFTRSPSLDFALVSPHHRSPGPIATPASSTTITRFRVRQKQLSSLAERSGQLLDRMIDQATPLGDLGDTLGPSQSGAAAGALPEKLLDLQDDMEVQVASLETKLGLCKTIVKQQEATDAFLGLCAESVTDSQSVLERLRSALKGRPSRDDRDELSALLLRASNTLPGPVNESSFGAFRHPEYPQLANTGKTMLSHVTNARRSASDALTDAKEALAYAEKAFDAWSAISALEADMTRSIAGIQALSTSLSLAISRSERPHEPLFAVADLCDEADGAIASAETQLQLFGIAVHRLRHLVSAPPPTLASEANDRDRSFPVDDLGAQFETVQTESRGLRTLVESARTAQMVDPLLRRATDGLDSIGDDARRLEMCLCDEIDAAAFGATAASKTAPKDLRQQYRQLVAQFQMDVVAALAGIEAAPRSSYLAQLEPHLADLRKRADACGAHLAAAGRLCNLLDAVEQQAEAVEAAQREADEILRKIASLSGVVAGEPAAGQLRDEIDHWSTGLAGRVRLISDLSSSPPELTTGDSIDRPRPLTDLHALDRRVRAHVNELSARVLAAAQSFMYGDGKPTTAGDDVAISDTDEDALDGMSSDNDSVPPDSPTKMASRLPAPTRIPSLQQSAPRTSSPAASSSRSAFSAKLSSPRTNTNSSDDLDIDGQGRYRTVSDTPTRSRSAIPRASLGNGLVGGRQYATVRDSRTSRASLPSVMQATDPARRSHGPKSPAKKRVLKAYISNERSELDVAVGSIINTLKVDIPIVPVGMNDANEWTDQSGKYWIGTEGRAKLCFCRILRSKTVMVRVGGGWVELSKFLLDHFADAFWQSATDSMAPATPVRAAGAGGSLPSAGPSNDLSLYVSGTPRAPNTPASRIPVAIGLGTPRAGSSRIPLPTLQSAEPGPAMPETPPPHGAMPATPGGGGVQPLGLIRSPSINGVSSPLVPLQFLRKASESPPVREKEKEKFASPRRSILGRESAPTSPTKSVIRAP